MKKIALIILASIAVIVMAIIAIRLQTPEDTWLCQNGTWVKHGNPSAPAPVKPCNNKNFS